MPDNEDNVTIDGAVRLYGLSRPVTSAAEIESAQLAALLDIRLELRGIHAALSRLAPDVSSQGPAPGASPVPAVAAGSASVGPEAATKGEAATGEGKKPAAKKAARKR
jgi:hypothetical protein